MTSQDSVFEPRDITGTLTPPPKPLSARAWAAIIGGVIVAAALVVLLIIWLRRLARRPAPPILPEVWALRELSLLEIASQAESWQPREFYYRLSEIVRVYIERKFILAAPEMTTEEFLTAVAQHAGPIPNGDTAGLQAFLEACDVVKYAAFDPGADVAGQALATARGFVRATVATRTLVGTLATPSVGEQAA